MHHQLKRTVGHAQVVARLLLPRNLLVPARFRLHRERQTQQMRAENQNLVLPIKARPVHVLFQHPLQGVELEEPPFALKPFRRHGVKNEKVRERRRFLRVAVHHARRPCVQIRQLEALVALLRVDFAELLEFLARHQQIHVVIPRNEPLVAHRPQERTAHHIIGNIVLLANSGNVPQLLQ